MSSTVMPRARARRLLHVMGASAVAIAAGLAVPAHAQCTPNPAEGDVAATCSGTESNGLALSGRPTVDVAEGAIVRAAPGGASAISVTAAPNSTTLAQITVAASARVEGPVGIDVAASGWFPTWATVILDNSGTIASTGGGYALQGNESAGGRFQVITNRASGVIGAIHAQVGMLNNEGLIDGGALSAFSDVGGPLQYYGQGAVVNSGTIRSSGSADTLFFSRAFNPGDYVTNSGLIENLGTGRAVGGQTLVYLSNEASGRVIGQQTAVGASNFVQVRNFGTITGSGDAVASGGNLDLVNRGTINGTVRAASYSSTIDNGGGTINGSLLLGGGDDVFIGNVADLANPIGTITGVLDAGGGMDVLRLTFMEDTVLDAEIPLPATIDALALRVGGSSTLTLSESFAGTTALLIGGGDTSFFNPENQFVLNGSITAQGPALLSDGAAAGGYGVTHNGTIDAALAAPGDFAINLRSLSDFTNTGTIDATGGGGVRLDATNTMRNSGTITADGTAVAAGYVALDNSGTIRSLYGIGLTLEGSGTTTTVNSGLIEGEIAGARVYYSILKNSGTISSAHTGVEMGIGGVLENLAGGVISGGAHGIGPSTAYSNVQGARVVNGGTINGGVDFGQALVNGPYGSYNVFIALAGSQVNGDIHLGSGRDIFATTLVNDGPGEFAGLTGQVTGSGQETIRYLVGEDASATPELRGIFSAVAYELSNDAVLTLVSPTALEFNLGFAGTGTVDLTADMSGRGDGVLIDLHQLSLQQGPDGAALPTAIDLTSRGTITVVKDPTLQPVVFSQAAVSLAKGDTFTNAGTIAASATPPPPNGWQPPFSAIRTLGGTVINEGTITVSGATGIRGSTFYGEDGATVINSGLIEQLAGGPAATGIADVSKVVNTGTIRTDGPAIIMSAPTTVINSGTISSGTSAAIQSSGYALGRIDNQLGGSITGAAGGPVITLVAGSVVRNAGTITGDVVLEYNMFGSPSTGTSVYVNHGGTLTGNLTLSAGDDVFIAENGETGVSGSIDTGLGFDTFASGYTTSATADLDALAGGRPTGFERSGIGAFGADTTVTLASASGYDAALLLVGDGTVVNTATINTATASPGVQSSASYLSLGTGADYANEFGAGSSLAFVNQGRIENGVGGFARIFDNQGYVDVNPAFGASVALTANSAAGLAFRNSGEIVGGTTSISQLYSIPQIAEITFDNSGSIAGGLRIEGAPDRFAFTNSGHIESQLAYVEPVRVSLGQANVNASEAMFANDGVLYDGIDAIVAAKRVTFANSGTIGHAAGWAELRLSQSGLRTPDQPSYENGTLDQESMAFVNSGAILGSASLFSRAPVVEVENSGSVATVLGGGLTGSAFETVVQSTGDQTVTVRNGGSIDASGPGASGVFVWSLPIGTDGNLGDVVNSSITLTNSGTIRADGGAVFVPAGPFPYAPYDTISLVTAVNVSASSEGNGEVTILNEAGATISASGGTKALAVPYGALSDAVPPYSELGSLAVAVAADKLTLVNAGTISGLAGGVIPSGTFLSTFTQIDELPDGYLAGAIQTFGSVDSVTNTSTGIITGSIHLGGGDDRLENSGLLRGTTYLGLGDDTLTLVAGGVVEGLVDGGEGTDAVLVLASGDGSVAGDTLAGFESLSQSGTGTIAYSGTFGVDTIGLSGGNLRVEAGAALATAGATTVTGTAGSETVTVAGSLAGAIALGDGDDRFAEIGAGRATGAVDGGGGRDLYALTLSGDRAGVSAVSGFEELAVGGSGTLTLDKSFELVSLAGVDLVMGAGGGAGAIQGSAAAERVTSAGDLARVALGGGDDTLSLGATVLGGSYLGDAGTDTLVLTAADAVRLDGTLAGFEQIAATSGALSVAGTLGAAGESVSLGDGAQVLTLLAGGRLTGTVDLAGGDDYLRLEGGTLGGRVEGGAGADVAMIATTGDTTLSAVLGGFEQLRTEGSGGLSLTQGAFQFDRIDAATDLRIAADAALTASQVVFGARDDRLTIAGGFAGSVAGGAGSDTLTVSGGTEASPVRFASISEFEAFAMTGGYAVLSGQAQFGTLTMTGGRFTGLAGSTLSATTITVSPGATFGSAGTVNAGLAIASGATFSPGASPAVMTVNGNVSLAGGSTTLFEFVPAPGQSDQLLIDGNLTIAAGAVLNLTGSRPLTPGVAYDMIVADSITGQFTIGTWDRNAVQGFLRYLDGTAQDRLQLLGTFVSLDPLPGAAGGAVAYVNDLLVSGGASSALLDSVNTLLDGTGYASAQAFGLLTPEVYASAMQLGTENGLVLAKAGRSGVMDATGERPALFTFGTGTGAWRSLDAVAATGASGVENSVYEVLGGIGYGSERASLAGFVGYLDGQQRIATLGANTDADGMVAGVSGHVALGGLQLHGLVSYDWSSADTARVVPGAATVSSDYDLDSLVLDAVASYDAPIGPGLVLTPAVGITHVATDRSATRESGSAAFALDVDGDSHSATFIDGALALRAAATSAIRPWAEIGVRHQLGGELPFASAGLAGSSSRFAVPGVGREQTVITYGAGFEATVAESVSLFAGYRGESGDGSGSNLTGGVQVRF